MAAVSLMVDAPPAELMADIGAIDAAERGLMRTLDRVAANADGVREP